MTPDNLMHTEWNREALLDYWQNMHLYGAWSNLVLGIIILGVAFLSIRHDWKELKKRVSAMSLFFLSIFIVNLVASMSHMIEHYPPIAKTLRLDLDFVNHSAIGFCALWVEVSILERVRTLQKIGFLSGFPKRLFLSLVIITYVIFQSLNWSIRNEPNFIFAIADYMLSLTTLLAFSLFVIFRLPTFIDKRYEHFSIASFVILLGASIAHIGLQEALPLGEAFINANDVYHFIAAPAFFTLFKAKQSSKSSIRLPVEDSLDMGMDSASATTDASTVKPALV
ncbi:MAG: hypothetical protein AAF664_20585 [Planctomycetota bacterium]